MELPDVLANVVEILEVIQLLLLSAGLLLQDLRLRCLLVGEALGVLCARGLAIFHELHVVLVRGFFTVLDVLHNHVHEGHDTTALLGALLVRPHLWHDWLLRLWWEWICASALAPARIFSSIV